MEKQKYKGKKIGPYKVVEEGSTKKYAEMTEDLNPLYVDEEYAKKSKYEGIIAPQTMRSHICSHPSSIPSRILTCPR